MRLTSKSSEVVLIVILATLLTHGMARPSLLGAQVDTENTRVVRTQRATCSLLGYKSKWHILDDESCGDHCISILRGYKGGLCRSGVCHCQR